MTIKPKHVVKVRRPLPDGVGFEKVDLVKLPEDEFRVTLVDHLCRAGILNGEKLDDELEPEDVITPSVAITNKP